MSLKYPALLLTPVFSYWTFCGTGGSSKRKPDSMLKISFRLTYGNVFITTFCHLGLFAVHFFKVLVHTSKINENLKFYIASFSCLIISWITLIILLNLQKCQNSYCKCCPQVFQKTHLDPNNPDVLIDPLKHFELEDIEMVVQVPFIQKGSKYSFLEDIRTLPKKLKNVASGSVFMSDKPKQLK